MALVEKMYNRWPHMEDYLYENTIPEAMYDAMRTFVIRNKIGIGETITKDQYDGMVDFMQWWILIYLNRKK